MAGYTKLFGSILESTVWMETPPIKVVWITMMAMADRDGVVEASVPGLTNRARVSREECEEALSVFLAPDPDSRTTAHDGRRIAVVPGGWRLLNYEQYRERASAEEVRIKATARKRRQREREAAASQNVTNVTNVPLGHDIAEASPSPPAEAKNAIARAEDAGPRKGSGGSVLAGALPREHLSHAACDPTYARCLPSAVHAKLKNLLAPKFGGDRDQADDALRTWYPTVWATLPDEFVMPDAFKFWQARFDARWATADAAAGPRRSAVPNADESAERRRQDRLAGGLPA